LVTDRSPYPVVYTAAEAFGEKALISESFQQFLKDWEALCYITPDLETLEPWVTGSNAVFDVSGEKTELLQGLFAKKLSDEEPREEQFYLGADICSMGRFLADDVEGRMRKTLKNFVG
jgi:hypothetical protein